MGLNLALLTDGLFPEFLGGMQKHSSFMAKYLGALDTQINVFAPVPPNTQSYCHEFPDNVRVHRVPFPPYGNLPGHYIRQRYRFSVNVYESIRRQLSKYDVIYIQGFSGWELLRQKQNGLKCPPTILNFHGLEMFQRAASFKHWIGCRTLRPFALKNLRFADFAQSLGGKLTDILKSLIPTEKVIEIGIGIPNDFSQMENVQTSKCGNRKFVFVGRYERRKGIEELNRVIESLGCEFGGSFKFIGPIPSNRQINHPVVNYLGQLTEPAQLSRILSESDVLICPSFSEGMPTVILEAMATSNAIIATDVGATRNMVDNTNGWLPPSPKSDQLRAAILEANRIPAHELKAKQQRSREKFRTNHTWEQVAQQMFQKFETISQHSNPKF